jgi:hypothetical protein
MAKIYSKDIHLFLSHILNENPNILEKDILGKAPKIKSRKTVKETLIHMEESQIIMNPYLHIRNCGGYSNHYLIAEVKNWKDLYERIICRNWEAIDSAFYIRSWKRNRLAYIKYHNTLEEEVQNVLEKGPIDYVCVIHPQSVTDNELKIPDVEPERSHIPSDNLDKTFDWDYDTKQVFWWLSINYRLGLTQIGRQLGVTRTTVRRKKRQIEEFTHIYYPTFIHSRPNYTRILSSFHTEYSEYIKEIFQRLSATCYLFGNQDRILLFVNTILPSYSIEVLEEMEERGIIEDLNTEIAVRGWNRIVEQYRIGKIPERFFWMFKGRIKKKK